MYIGEALVGEGNEIAHIDLLIGDKDGPVGVAFANALANQTAGHSNLLAVLTPNLICKPATVLITKVTIKGAEQAVQMFGPAQAAVAKAVADSVADGVIPKAEAENLVIVCGVFIHWEAKDDNKIYQYNYEATKLAIKRAMKGEPKIDEITRQEGHGQAPVLAEVSLQRSRSRERQQADDSSPLTRVAAPVMPLTTAMDKPTILVQLDTDPQPSVFDRVVAVDAGAEHVFSYGGVTPEKVRDARPRLHLHPRAEGPAPHRDLRRRVGRGRRRGGAGRGPEAPAPAVRAARLGDARLQRREHDRRRRRPRRRPAPRPRRTRRRWSSAAPARSASGSPGCWPGQGAQVRVGSRQKDRAEAVCDGHPRAACPARRSRPSRRRVGRRPGGAGRARRWSSRPGRRGWCCCRRSTARRPRRCKVAIDLNAVPPAGIEGVELTDKAARARRRASATGRSASAARR